MTAPLAQNVITDIDDNTGAVKVDEASIFSAFGEVRLICPSMHGGSTGSGRLQSLTGILYFHLRNDCMPALTTTDEDGSHRIYAISVGFELSEGKDDLSRIHAISASTGRTEWLYEHRAWSPPAAGCCSAATRTVDA